MHPPSFTFYFAPPPLCNAARLAPAGGNMPHICGGSQKQSYQSGLSICAQSSSTRLTSNFGGDFGS
eukprot:12703740-Prorocentrum_lima.AAC.1